MKNLLLLIVVVLLATPSQLSSCRCAPVALKDAFNQADVVFVGQVIKAQFMDDEKDRAIEPRMVVTFNVTAYWKGEVNQTMTLHTYWERSTCSGNRFKVGDLLIVFATKESAVRWVRGEGLSSLPLLEGDGLPKPDEYILGTTICTRTTIADSKDARQDIKALGPAKVPAK